MKPINPLKLEGARPLPEEVIDAMDHVDASRREFLKTAGVMMIGFGIGAATAEAQSPIKPSGNVGRYSGGQLGRHRRRREHHCIRG